MHVRDSVDRLYCSRREGGRGLSGVCACVKAEENSLAYYVSQTLQPVLGRQKIVNLVQCVEPNDYKEAEKLKGMQSWKNKDMLGQFVRDTEPVSDKEKPWGWLWNGDLKKETEGMILTAQGQTLRTNYVKFRIDHSYFHQNVGCVVIRIKQCGM